MENNDGYVIEGTISEITFNNKGKINYFKINGTEEFALQKKESGKTIRFNILCEKRKESDDILNAIIFKSDSEIKCNDKFLPTLSSALASGKRIKIIIDKKDSGDFKINDKDVGILNSLSIFS